MNGQEFVDEIRRVIQSSTGQSGTEKQVADYLGVSVQTISRWRRRENISARSMSDTISRAKYRRSYELQENAIYPIVEFFRINPETSSRGARVEVFGAIGENGEEHPYLAGVRDHLRNNQGVYIFYDSRGRALYVGRTTGQSLWDEVNQAYNRDRGSIQGIRRVDHPERRQDFRTYDEMTRKIRARSVPLSEIAEYFSAYRIAAPLIKSIEALLIRGFPNDILNKRMENFRS